MAMLEYGDDFIVQDALSYITGKTDNIVIRPKISVKELLGGGCVNLKPSMRLREYYNYVFYHGSSPTLSQDQNYFSLVLTVLQKLRDEDADNDDEAYDAMSSEDIFKLLVEEGTLFDRDDEDDEDYHDRSSKQVRETKELIAPLRTKDEQAIINFLTLGDDSEFNESKKKMAIDFLNTKWFPWLYQIASNSNKKKTVTKWIQVNPNNKSQEIRDDTTILISQNDGAYMLRVVKPIDIQQVKVFCRCHSLSLSDQMKSPGDATIGFVDDETTVASIAGLDNDGSVLDASGVMASLMVTSTPKPQVKRKRVRSFFMLPARVEGKHPNVLRCKRCGTFLHIKCHKDLDGCCNCFHDGAPIGKLLFDDNDDEYEALENEEN
jgi:hypothetical protein